MNENQKTKNEVNLIGYISFGGDEKGQIAEVGKDGAIKRLQFSLATSYKAGNEIKSMWHQVVAWSKIAEEIAGQTRKGDRVEIKGFLRVNKYQHKDGYNVTKVEIVTDNWSLVEQKKERKTPEEIKAQKQIEKEMEEGHSPDFFDIQR